MMAGPSGRSTVTATKPLPRKQLLAFPAPMPPRRRFEEKVEERFRVGELPGFLHLCIGQEAATVGVCGTLGDEDVLGSTRRARGHVITMGWEERMDGEACQAVAEAVAFAKVGADPKPMDALLNVYAGAEG